MQTNHFRERKKKPFLWIIVVVAVLLAGAFVLYSRHMQTRPPQVRTPVIARGKIPPPPPSPSMEPPAGPSTSMESAPPTEADSHENASDIGSQSDLESSPAASGGAGPQKSVPEMKSQIAAPAQEDAAADTGQEFVDDTEQTGASDSSDGQASAPGSDENRPATTAVDEQQVAVQETPESLPSSETVASPPSALSATEAELTPSASLPSLPDKAAPYTIQVGAYRSKINADRQVAQLREKGFDTYLYEKNDKDQRAWYFVRFGRFESFRAADQALAVFKDQEHMDGAIVRSNSN